MISELVNLCQLIDLIICLHIQGVCISIVLLPECLPNLKIKVPEVLLTKLINHPDSAVPRIWVEMFGSIHCLILNGRKVLNRCPNITESNNQGSVGNPRCQSFFLL